MTHPPTHCLRWLTLIATALAPSITWGQVMLSPVAVVETDLGTYSEETPLVNLINQSGVERPFVSGTTDFNTYFAVPHQTLATNGPANNWQSEVAFTLPLQGYVDFDLGASRSVSKLAFWNVTAEDVTLRFAEDPAALPTAPVAGTFRLTNHSSYPFSYAVDVVALGTPQQGRYLRLGIDSAYRLVPGFNFTYAILGEVVVSAAPIGAPSLTIARQPNGDVQITFGGTLQSAAALDGPFLDVPGNPTGTFLLPGGNLAEQQYFRSR